MNIYGIGRLKDGSKESITVSGYASEEHLPLVFEAVKKNMSHVRMVLFLVPKKPLNFKLKEQI